MSDRHQSQEQEGLSKSWSRRQSFLSRQGTHNRISSADHVITVSDTRRDAATSPGPLSPQDLGIASTAAAAAASAAVEAALAASSAPASVPSPAFNKPSSEQNYSVSVGSADEDSLATPLLQSSTAEHGEGGATPFAATVAARAAAAAVKALSSGKCNGVGLQQEQLGQFRGSVAPSVEGADDSAGTASSNKQFQRKLAFAYSLSWAVNILLLVAKIYAYWVSQSKAVLASAADSAVDLVSQVVIAYADWKIKQEDPRFPVGQARLEAIGVLACACIMSVASFEVINESVQVVITTLQTGKLPELELGLVMYVVLGSATALKVLCWAVCAALQSRSDSMLALAEDHLNDIMSNLCAIITAVLAGWVPNGWWIDPAGAVAISMYIVVRWLAIAKQQVDKIVGRGAPALFLQQLEELANSHHAALGLDVIRAYHFGARYIVEMEVVLPAEMSVKDSHDISLDLQHKVEQLDEVERAFVHVDYMRRDGLEHKVERELALAAARSTSVGSGSRHSAGGGAGDSAAGAAGAVQSQQGAVESLV